MPERKVASTGDRTHNYQVMSRTHSPLSHLDGAFLFFYHIFQTVKAINSKLLTLTEHIIPFPNKLWFLRVCNRSLLKTLGKEEINEQFLLFPECFLSILRAFCYFYEIRNCCLQTLSIRKSLEFVVWERVMEKSSAQEP